MSQEQRVFLVVTFIDGNQYDAIVIQKDPVNDIDCLEDIK